MSHHGRRRMASEVPSDAICELRFFFERGGCWLWPFNGAARCDFGLGPQGMLEPCPFPLSPGLGAVPEACELLADIRRELGTAFRLLDWRTLCSDDPELDAYWADSKAFLRREKEAEPGAAPDRRRLFVSGSS